MNVRELNYPRQKKCRALSREEVRSNSGTDKVKGI